MPDPVTPPDSAPATLFVTLLGSAVWEANVRRPDGVAEGRVVVEYRRADLELIAEYAGWDKPRRVDPLSGNDIEMRHDIPTMVEIERLASLCEGVSIDKGPSIRNIRDAGVALRSIAQALVDQDRRHANQLAGRDGEISLLRAIVGKPAADVPKSADDHLRAAAIAAALATVRDASKLLEAIDGTEAQEARYERLAMELTGVEHVLKQGIPKAAPSKDDISLAEAYRDQRDRALLGVVEATKREDEMRQLLDVANRDRDIAQAERDALKAGLNAIREALGFPALGDAIPDARAYSDEQRERAAGALVGTSFVGCNDDPRPYVDEIAKALGMRRAGA
jgi:hypothetical protein